MLKKHHDDRNMIRTSSVKSPPSFLSLPAEIRKVIYGYLLSADQPILLFDESEMRALPDSNLPRGVRVSLNNFDGRGLLGTSTLIAREATEYLRNGSSIGAVLPLQTTSNGDILIKFRRNNNDQRIVWDRLVGVYPSLIWGLDLKIDHLRDDAFFKLLTSPAMPRLQVIRFTMKVNCSIERLPGCSALETFLHIENSAKRRKAAKWRPMFEAMEEVVRSTFAIFAANSSIMCSHSGGTLYLCEEKYNEDSITYRFDIVRGKSDWGERFPIAGQYALGGVDLIELRLVVTAWNIWKIGRGVRILKRAQRRYDRALSAAAAEEEEE